MTFSPRVRPFGERALLLEVADAFGEDAVAWCGALADAWERAGLGAAVPAYASVVLHFDPEALRPDEAERRARELLRGERPPSSGVPGRIVEIPTRYDGPDLEDVARRSGLAVGEVVRLHAGRTYTAYFLGFLPGFAYLGRLDPRIVAPRLDRPRQRVPAGSVAIADGQTAVYPFTSPGGWRLIGTTGLTLFDATSPDPAVIRAGDRVRFVPT